MSSEFIQPLALLYANFSFQVMAFNNTTPLPWLTSHDTTPAYDANDTEMEILIEPTQVEPAGPSTQTQYWHAIDDGAWGVLEPENNKSPPIKLFAPIVYIGRGPYAPRVVDCIQIDHPNVSKYLYIVLLTNRLLRDRDTWHCRP